MASKTTNLGLIKPAKGEYFNSWNVPVNANFDKIDQAVGDLQTEVQDARGTQASLSDRLDNGLNADGTLKPTTEIVKARSSKVYGSDDVNGDFDVDTRIEQADREIWDARAQLSSLRSGMAWMEDGNVNNSMISGPTNPLTFSGAVVTLNAGVTAVESNINGYRQVARVNKSVTISGAPGTYYLSLDRQPSGEVYFTGIAGSGTTSTFIPTGKLCKFSASATNFVTTGVKPGDILEITGPLGNPNKGQYIVHSTNVEDGVNLATNEIRVIGEFVSASTALDYQIINAITPALNFTGSAHAKKFAKASGKIYIGRCVFDGTNVTSLVNYALKGIYADFTSVTLSLGNFSSTVAHNLGFIPSKIEIYASQANDFSQPLEPLSIAEMSTGASSITTGSASLSPATPQVITYTPPALTYTPPTLMRSVIVRFTDTTIEIKNATNGVFYKDFSGSTQTSGYLYIVAER